MKSNAYTVEPALRVAQVEPADAVLTGDSVSDVQVAHAAGAQSLGYAKNPGRDAELERQGLMRLTECIAALAQDKSAE